MADGTPSRPIGWPVQPHRVLYSAFDRYPAPKGAAVHIRQMAGTLFELAGGGLLYVLGDETLPRYQREGPIEIVRHARPETNLLRRALAFGGQLAAVLDQQAASLQLCHFRDPWGGQPIVERAGRGYRTIYEINGLPSIELPMAYPWLTPATIAKLRASEERCWAAADAIITPSASLRANLIGLGAPAERIVVIPNGAELGGPVPPPPGAPARYLLYFGAVQAWQGVDVLLRAFAQLADLVDLELVLCVATRPRTAQTYQKLAARLGVSQRLRWLFQLSEAELAPWRAHAQLSVAPLTESPRNLAQGCCPLKILESMAAGVPVVASDLPSVREIVTDGQHGRLVRPDRPAELARAIRILLEYPEQRARLGAQARQRIAAGLTWRHATTALADLYRRLCPALAQPVD